MKTIHRLFLLCSIPALLSAQVLDNSSLSGGYHFVHLLVSVSVGGEATNARNLGGTVTFDGNGSYTFEGQIGSGAGAPTASAGAGSYSVASNGFVTLTNPIEGSLQINARLGVDAEIVLGNSTGATDGSYDLFVAIRAPAGGVSNATLSGAYTGGSLWFPNGRDLALKTSLVSLTADGQGAFTSGTARGHAADQDDVGVQESVVNATYSLGEGGGGTANFGTSSTLFSGDRRIFVSASGDYLIGYSTEAGGRDIFLTVKNFSTSANNGSWDGNYWIAELHVDAARNVYTSATGGIRSNAAGSASISERTRIDLLPLDFSGINSYLINADSTGFLGGFLAPEVTNFAVGTPIGAGPAGTFVNAEIDIVGVQFTDHGVAFGVRVPNITGSGVFLSPLGVLNAGSFAPPTYPVAGGTLLSLFGSGLAPSTALAESIPLPTSLAGVSVRISGVLAPLLFVSDAQINLQTPFSTTGNSGTVVVDNNGTSSDEVPVDVGSSSPAVFSVLQTGIGPGTITHANFSLVTEQNPAAPGETVIVFLTGLGELSPPVADGAAGPVDPLSQTTDRNVQVLFYNEAGRILFSGAAPGFVGLYQVNVTIPSPVVGGTAVPVAISTTNAFSDFVDIAIGF